MPYRMPAPFQGIVGGKTYYPGQILPGSATEYEVRVSVPTSYTASGGGSVVGGQVLVPTGWTMVSVTVPYGASAIDVGVEIEAARQSAISQGSGTVSIGPISSGS